MENSEIIQRLGFQTWFDVRGRLSIADLVPKSENRCGIYLLEFANGEFYVGQAINVCRRYGQHCQTYNDITKLTFKCVTPDKLNKEEKQIIQTLEKIGFRLRNIIHTSITYSPSPLIEIMSPEEQKRWQEDIYYSNLTGDRLDDPELRNKYTTKFSRLMSLPYAEDIVGVLKKYVLKCIPVPILSEKNYWSCSCLSQKISTEQILYSRININQQAVFHAYTFQDQPLFSWHISKSPLTTTFRKRIRVYRRYWQFRLLPTSQRYQPGGQDQFTIQTVGENALQDALNMLDDPDFLHAIRTFNLRLMQKGPTWFYRYHCFQLADRFFE